MSELTLISDFSLDTTSLSNIYIDEYMSANNESQVKIYLYLLRNISSGRAVSSVSIADAFNYSVMDVERALRYMENQGLMSLKVEGENIVGLRLLPLKKKSSVSNSAEGFKLIQMENSASSDKTELKREIVKPEYSAAQVSEFYEAQGVEELMFAIQQILGRPLKPADVKSIMFINRELGLSIDVIDYLIDYCVERNKKSFRYIEEVARDWHDNGVVTVKDAKSLSTDIPKEVYEVFNAFSIKAGCRKPSNSEVKFVKKWTNEYAFTMDIIKKACEITLDRTHSVSFEYADAILTDWNKKGVKHLSDIEKLSAKPQDSGKSPKKGRPGFTGMAGRDYDFAQLEKELLRK